MIHSARLITLITLTTLLAANAVAAGDAVRREQQRLDGYGWSLYKPMFLRDEAGALPPALGQDSWWGGGSPGQGGSLAPGMEDYGTLWQDPQQGLTNTIGSYLAGEGSRIHEYGAGGEYYYGSLTAMGQAGYLDGSIDRQSFAGIDLRWYARENISLQIGWEQFNDSNLGNLRLEYAPRLHALSGLSFFAGASGDGLERHYFIGGLRYSFGSSSSLRLRDRRDPGAARDSLSPYFRSLWFEP